MATSSVSLSTTVWTKITDAGESGTCWKKTGGTIVVDHTDQETDATLALTNTNVTQAKSKRVPLDEDTIETLDLPADNDSDIFYALATEDVTAPIIVVDVL